MSSLPAAPTRLSAFDAVGDSVQLVQRRLFPFVFERWLALGFLAFLDQCGRRAGGFNGRFPGGGGGPGKGGGGIDQADVSRMTEWISAHVGLLVVIAAAALVFVVAVTAVVQWLNSRGVFMYLDAVASGRSDVARPWREHKDRAWSYFAWSFGLSLLGLAGILVLLVPMALAILSLFRSGARAAPILGLVATGLCLLIFLLGLGLLSLVLRDFAAPLQMHLGLSCGRALAAAGVVIRHHPGAFLVYLLLKIVFSLVAGLGALIVGCCTCCLGFLPVVAQTILQPLFYFERAWSLFLLRQAGFDLFATVGESSGQPYA